ncbi:MAG: MBL fold metallo-hydrolase [Thermoplasmatota archaeon]
MDLPFDPSTYRVDMERGRFRALRQWQRDRKVLVKAYEARGEQPALRVENDGASIAATDGTLTWVGHSTFILRVAGKTIYTDPIFSSRAGGVVKRHVAPSPRLADAPRPDLVLLSHNHYDHLDAASVKALGTDAAFRVPRGVKKWFTSRKFRDVEELDWWQTTETAGFKLTFVPAQHFSGRALWDRNKTQWGGWVLETLRGFTLYFAGDSGYFSGFKEIGARFPHIDVAIIPIGAYWPRNFMEEVHVSPAEAVQAFLDVGARTFVPCHWGTFRLAMEALDDPPRHLAAAWADAKLAPERLLSPVIGETIALPGAAAGLTPVRGDATA